MPNIFGIVDDILVIRYDEDGVDHDAAVHKVLSHFSGMPIPFFGEVILREGSSQIPKNQSDDRHAGTKEQEGTTGLFRYN